MTLSIGFTAFRRAEFLCGAFLAALALMLLSPPAHAQQCTAPAQVCAPGANGDGGCFAPGAALCVAGMICEAGLSVCPPGAGGEGGCFNPAKQSCNSGALTAISAAPPLGTAAADAAPSQCHSRRARIARRSSSVARAGLGVAQRRDQIQGRAHPNLRRLGLRARHAVEPGRRRDGLRGHPLRGRHQPSCRRPDAPQRRQLGADRFRPLPQRRRMGGLAGALPRPVNPV